jgi:prostaglandin-E synthase
MALYPEVLWAQRADVLYITVNLTDIKEQNIQLDKTSLKFKAKGEAEQKDYEFNFEFFDEIDPEKSKQHLTGRSLFFLIQKSKEGWWPRLLKDKSKPHFLKTDFSKWKDEDEEEEEETNAPGGPGGDGGLANMDFSSILQNNGMGGGGGFGDDGGGDDEDESDEEGMPDLEEAAPK